MMFMTLVSDRRLLEENLRVAKKDTCTDTLTSMPFRAVEIDGWSHESSQAKLPSQPTNADTLTRRAMFIFATRHH